jgi:hypothetical protein
MYSAIRCNCVCKTPQSQELAAEVRQLTWGQRRPHNWPGMRKERAHWDCVMAEWWLPKVMTTQNCGHTLCGITVFEDTKRFES